MQNCSQSQGSESASWLSYDRCAPSVLRQKGNAKLRSVEGGNNETRNILQTVRPIHIASLPAEVVVARMQRARIIAELADKRRSPSVLVATYKLSACCGEQGETT